MRAFVRAHRPLIATLFGGLLVGAIAGGAVLIVAVSQGPATAVVAPSPSPSPSSPPAVGVGTIMDELHGNCIACHLKPDGGVGTKPIPPVGHPTQGWTACTACHARDRLVQTAPGHTGIHADQCLVCHTSTTAAAAMRPHGENVGNCLTCHGSSAPLPDSMKGYAATTCWLCHRASDEVTPAIPHPLEGNAVCESCHTAGMVGALPANHASRADNVCTACHEIRTTTPPAAPHSLVGLDGKCASCHGPDVTPGALPSPGSSAGPATSDASGARASAAPAGSHWPLVSPAASPRTGSPSP